MIEFDDENLLMLSGIQHVAFCERQWALIHVEQQWAENMRTIEGKHIHERVDDPWFSEYRKQTVILRSLPLVSRKLGLYGKADVIELIKTDDLKNSIKNSKYEGNWFPVPVEYKRGKPKPDERDEVQLCAQSICLEEMYNIETEKGYLYYGEIRHRKEVFLNQNLREKVLNYSIRMHQLFNEGITPSPSYKSHCKSCSLIEICMPKTFFNKSDVNLYIKNLFN